MGAGDAGLLLPILGEAAGEQAQAADAMRQIMFAQKSDGGDSEAAAAVCDSRQADCGQMVLQCLTQCGAVERGGGLCDDGGQGIHHAGEFQLGIGLVGVSGLGCGGMLRLVAPGRNAPGGGRIEEKCVTEEVLHRVFDIGAQGGYDGPQALHLTAFVRQRVEVVADRLFPRDRRQRAEDHRKPVRRAGIIALHAADALGVRVDIDEAAVNLALGRAGGEDRHSLGKGGVDQHRAVDQRGAGDFLRRGEVGQDARQEGGAAGPFCAALGGEGVDFGYL